MGLEYGVCRRAQGFRRLLRNDSPGSEFVHHSFTPPTMVTLFVQLSNPGRSASRNLREQGLGPEVVGQFHDVYEFVEADWLTEVGVRAELERALHVGLNVGRG